jgi:hypothetical protein
LSRSARPTQDTDPPAGYKGGKVGAVAPQTRRLTTSSGLI